jgi:hypothetical protein
MSLISTQLRIELIETGPKSALLDPESRYSRHGLCRLDHGVRVVDVANAAEIGLIDRDRRRAEGDAYETQCRDTVR